MKKLNVAICGFGTIGSGVYEVLNSLNKEEFEVVKVFDLEDERKRKILGDKLVTNLDDVINDETVDIVVETLGGLDFAYNVAKKALNAGKHVVSANKEVVSVYAKELSALARSKNLFYFYEASVGGGIPIIHELVKSSQMDKIERIYGIMNGTTNYILTEMFEKGSDFDAVIKEAQALGFAERDPSNDILGYDKYRKIKILTMLATGKELEIKKDICYPLKGITADFVKEMKLHNLTVRYLAIATLGNQPEISVEPVVIPNTHPLATATGALNYIVMDNKYNGPLSFMGYGAGKLATACSLVKDIKEIQRGNRYVDFNPHDKLELNSVISDKKYYIIQNGTIKTYTGPIDKIENVEFKARIL